MLTAEPHPQPELTGALQPQPELTTEPQPALTTEPQPQSLDTWLAITTSETQQPDERRANRRVPQPQSLLTVAAQHDGAGAATGAEQQVRAGAEQQLGAGAEQQVGAGAEQHVGAGAGQHVG